MPAAIPKNEIISFWTSVRQGAPLLFLLLVDMISIAKPTKEVSNLFLDSETYRILVFGGIYVLSVWITPEVVSWLTRLGVRRGRARSWRGSLSS